MNWIHLATIFIPLRQYSFCHSRQNSPAKNPFPYLICFSVWSSILYFYNYLYETPTTNNDRTRASHGRESRTLTRVLSRHSRIWSDDDVLRLCCLPLRGMIPSSYRTQYVERRMSTTSTTSHEWTLSFCDLASVTTRACESRPATDRCRLSSRWREWSWCLRSHLSPWSWLYRYRAL